MSYVLPLPTPKLVRRSTTSLCLATTHLHKSCGKGWGVREEGVYIIYVCMEGKNGDGYSRGAYVKVVCSVYMKEEEGGRWGTMDTRNSEIQ